VERKKGDGRTACDIIIVNACVLSMDARRTIYPDGAVAITGSTIAAVGPEREVTGAYRGRRLLDARGAVVHPGFVDGHCHVTIHLGRGAVPDDPGVKNGFGYADWFNHLGDGDEFVQTQCAAVEMLRNGYTFFLEPGTAFEPDAVAEAAEAVGVRGSVADPFLWDVPDGGNALVAPMAHRAPCDRAGALGRLGGQLWRNKDDARRIRGHVSLYGSGSQSEELMHAANACAEEHRVVMNMHHNFTPEQAERDDRRFGGRHTLVAFAEKKLIGRRSTFVHMNVVREDEVQPILDSGMALVWQPGNYMFYGIHARTQTRMPELIARGTPVTFGVDAAKVWTFGDLELIGYLVARQTGQYLSTEKILEMRTIDGARAVGLEDAIGSLEPGKRADVVIRSPSAPEAVPAVNPVQELLLGAQASTVDTVLVDGEIVWRDGRSTRVDLDAVSAAGRACARAVLKRAGYTPRSSWPMAT
jgi:cytosine/adenosine deaminase-related metal-dependent hydrolase